MFNPTGLNNYGKVFFEETPHKSSKSDQITQDQSSYQGHLKKKEPHMIIQIAYISAALGAVSFQKASSR
jgi:hypothetical protein